MNIIFTCRFHREDTSAAARLQDVADYRATKLSVELYKIAKGTCTHMHMHTHVHHHHHHQGSTRKKSHFPPGSATSTGNKVKAIMKSPAKTRRFLAAADVRQCACAHPIERWCPPWTHLSGINIQQQRASSVPRVVSRPPSMSIRQAHAISHAGEGSDILL